MAPGDATTQGQSVEQTVRAAYDAYSAGDVEAMLELFSPDLEWTYLDPSQADPEPQTCHGLADLRRGLQRQAERGLAGRVEELVVSGDRVLVVIHTPGLDRHRARAADDRNYDVLAVRAGRIVALRACRDRAEARALAGLEP
jgi:uncharacterized protein